MISLGNRKIQCAHKEFAAIYDASEGDTARSGGRPCKQRGETISMNKRRRPRVLASLLDAAVDSELGNLVAANSLAPNRDLFCATLNLPSLSCFLHSYVLS